MTNDELRKIEERAEKASEGPWSGGAVEGGITGIGQYVEDCVARSPLVDYWIVTCEKTDGKYDVCHTGNGPTSEANFQFIAHAREDIPALIARVRELDLIIETYNQHTEELEGIVQRLEDEIGKYRKLEEAARVIPNCYKWNKSACPKDCPNFKKRGSCPWHNFNNALAALEEKS